MVESGTLRNLYCIMQSECSYNAVHECVAHMLAKKPKLKTAVMTMRVDPQVKAAAKLAAVRARRSVTSLIEVLVLDHCKDIGIDLSAQKRKGGSGR